MGGSCCKPQPSVNAEIKDNETDCCENITCCVSYNISTIESQKQKELCNIDKKIEKLNKLRQNKEQYYENKKNKDKIQLTSL